MSSGPVVVRRAQEAVPVGKNLQDPLGEDVAPLLRLGLEDLEDQVLLAHGGGAGDVQLPCQIGKIGDVHSGQGIDREVLARAADRRDVAGGTVDGGRAGRRTAALADRLLGGCLAWRPLLLADLAWGAPGAVAAGAGPFTRTGSGHESLLET